MRINIVTIVAITTKTTVKLFAILSLHTLFLPYINTAIIMKK